MSEMTFDYYLLIDGKIFFAKAQKLESARLRQKEEKEFCKLQWIIGPWCFQSA